MQSFFFQHSFCNSLLGIWVDEIPNVSSRSKLIWLYEHMRGNPLLCFSTANLSTSSDILIINVLEIVISMSQPLLTV